MIAAIAWCIPAHATIPEPDNLVYGNISLDGALVTAARTDVVIEARRSTNGPAISSYRMGSSPSLGNFYSLRLLLESVTPLSNTNASQISQSVFIVVTDGSGLRAQTNYIIADRGLAQRVDFGAVAVDGDGDGLPDAWELHRYASLGQSPGSVAPNGLTALQNFIAGTDPSDPDDAFRLRIELTNNQKQVSFVALKAEGPGYDGMTRLYTLESSPAFGSGSWNSVPSYADIAGNNQTVNYVTAGPGLPDFFRGKVSLQGFTAPGAIGDSDGDGLPDAWEIVHFGNLIQTPESLNSNGENAAGNFIAGTDPNDPGSGFKLNVSRSGNETVVSFLARDASGAGYEGRQRSYALESSTAPGGPWDSVAALSNVQGNDQTVSRQFPNTSEPRFYRGRVWLEP